MGELYSINSDPSGLYYLACDGGCEAENNWQRIYLGDTGGGVDRSWDLEIDAQDRPHVAFYQGDVDGQGEKLNYLFCAAECLVHRTQWQTGDVGLVKRAGKHPDLEVNGQNQPRIAYIDEQGGLGYAWCNTGCENGGLFQQTTIESGNDLYPSMLPTMPAAGGTIRAIVPLPPTSFT